jgi:hypothetical protein
MPKRKSSISAFFNARPIAAPDEGSDGDHADAVDFPALTLIARMQHLEPGQFALRLVQLAPQRLNFTRGLIARTVRFCTHVTRTR